MSTSTTAPNSASLGEIATSLSRCPSAVSRRPPGPAGPSASTRQRRVRGRLPVSWDNQQRTTLIDAGWHHNLERRGLEDRAPPSAVAAQNPICQTSARTSCAGTALAQVRTLWVPPRTISSACRGSHQSMCGDSGSRQQAGMRPSGPERAIASPASLAPRGSSVH